MKITLVVAASENNVIGTNNELPWHLSDDLKFFKKVTSGKPVIMGRKTFESIGFVLPKRLNIVLSRNNPALPEGVLHFSSLAKALAHLQDIGTEEVCIIGGGTVFNESLPLADKVFLTRVHTQLDGDTFFPELEPDNWRLEKEEFHPQDERHAFSFTFREYTRVPH